MNGQELSAIAGITPNRRADWATQGLLRSAAPFGELDGAEAVALRVLVDSVGPKQGKNCWRSVRSALRAALARRAKRLWVVVDLQLQEHRLATTPTEVVAGATLGRPVHVIELAKEIRSAGTRYRAAVESGGGIARPQALRATAKSDQ